MRPFKTFYIARDEEDLEGLIDNVLCAVTADEALDDWIVNYDEPPAYIFEVRVVARAAVIPSKPEIKWGT